MTEERPTRYFRDIQILILQMIGFLITLIAIVTHLTDMTTKLLATQANLRVILIRSVSLLPALTRFLRIAGRLM